MISLMKNQENMAQLRKKQKGNWQNPSLNKELDKDSKCHICLKTKKYKYVEQRNKGIRNMTNE